MSDKRIADLLEIKTRFLRSAHLERDFHDPRALSGYVMTDFAQAQLQRIGEGLREGSGQRAWRVTGQYGSGKSSFALLLAHALAGHDNALPPQIRKALDFAKATKRKPAFLPVLVTGARQPMARSILEGLRHALDEAYKPAERLKGAKRLDAVAGGVPEPPDEAVVSAVMEVNSQLIADSKANGLVLVIDELGKFLEYAVLHPERQDVLLLQSLAEAASRSGGEPVFLVCLLHQGFDAYAEHLDPAASREWDKVAGRFEEIVFNQPVQQVGRLIASALNVQTARVPTDQRRSLLAAMQHAVRLGWFGGEPLSKLRELAPTLYPLHPTVLPVLIRVFREFAQNERSLFSFLLSNEPFGLRAFAERPLHKAELFRLHHLFDYVRANFGHRLAVRSYRSHWHLIDSVVESYATDDEAQTRILKTVGILNLLDDDLAPTEDALLCALADDNEARRKGIRTEVERLRRGRRVLYAAGDGAGLRLWSHSSVDLEKAYERANRAIGTPRLVATLLEGFVETRPLVARRHYIETGNLRHYEVRHCPVCELPGYFPKADPSADGFIIVPLCESASERQHALTFAAGAEFEKSPNWLVAIPQPLNHLAGLVREVQRWDWVETNTPELNADRYGREEVSRQRREARLRLERRVQSLTGFRQFGACAGLEWFRLGRRFPVADARDLLSKLSAFLEETYNRAPFIRNELINRRNLSSAAAAARMRLIERLFTQGGSPALGMDPKKKPPEMSMYMSVLLSTGMHQQQANAWRVMEPSPARDRAFRLLPTFGRIRELVQQSPDARIKISDLFDALRQAPFGVRDGLAPLLLTVFAIAHEQDIAFYKDGSFLRELGGEDIQLLIKAPNRFEIQSCKIEGVRADIFQKLLAVLGLTPADGRDAELLDVVKPLCVFVARLPAYVLATRKLSAAATKVRDTILNAREPVALLFRDLPNACAFEPFPPSAPPDGPQRGFVKALKTALDELRAAYPELQERLKYQFRAAFSLPGSSFREFRAALAGHAERVVLGVTEAQLRAFCLRLRDDSLPESEWLESLGSLVALRPPAKWNDGDEGLFARELGALAGRFRRVESILFAKGTRPNNSVGIRLAVTRADGTEHQRA